MLSLYKCERCGFKKHNKFITLTNPYNNVYNLYIFKNNKWNLQNKFFVSDELVYKNYVFVKILASLISFVYKYFIVILVFSNI